MIPVELKFIGCIHIVLCNALQSKVRAQKRVNGERPLKNGWAWGKKNMMTSFFIASKSYNYTYISVSLTVPLLLCRGGMMDIMKDQFQEGRHKSAVVLID